jgi:hypothetical protein
MTPEQRNTPQQVQGIVRMVYDLCEQHNRIPDAHNFYAAIRKWLELEQTPKVLYDIGIEINDSGGFCVICRAYVAEPNKHGAFFCPDCLPSIPLVKGDYVLATKWSDGDPQDAWCVGFFSHMLGERYIVVDDKDKPFRANGFRKAQVITKERGEWLLKNARHIETTDMGLWDYWIHQPMEWI